MHLEPPEISIYCEQKSSTPSEICGEIARFTTENDPMAIMLSGPLVGSFLGFLVGTLGARKVLEIGCFTGYTALSMAEKLPDGGSLITLDVSEEWGSLAKDFWAKSEHGGKISLKLGPALETLDSLEGPFDMVYIDADKANYLNYLKKVLPRLSEKGVVIADNALQEGKVLENPAPDGSARALQEFNDWVSKQSDLQSVLLPIRDGLMLIRKLEGDCHEALS